MHYIDPFYRYDLTLLERTISVAQREAKMNNIALFYAIKANHEPEILEKVRAFNLGIDAVSGEEIKHSLNHGFKPGQIVFAGSGKTYKEIEYALFENIRIIHCESVEEFYLIQNLRKKLNSTTQVALRLNPDFKVDTFDKISTGENTHKFGVTEAEAVKLISEYGNEIIGFHVHVGSQIENLEYFKSLSKHIANLLDRFTNYHPAYLNLGGGLGINYKEPKTFPVPDFKGWMCAIRTYLPESKFPTLALEPGRSLVGQCGKLIAQVQYIKERNNCKIALLNVGMSALLRPMLYGAYHKVTTLNASFEFDTYKIAGPSCESTDVFHENYTIEKLFVGDIVEIHSTGAYGSSMQLNYNLKQAIAKKFITQSTQTIIKCTHEKAASSRKKVPNLRTSI